MGRDSVDSAPRVDSKGCAPGCQCGRHRSNSGSFDQNRGNLGAGAATRYVRKHPLPSIGDRFGELTVLGLERQRRGACDYDMVRVQCSCGAEPHLVFDYNLRKGRSTRCNACAKKQSAYWRKTYSGYADLCSDDASRVRLLDRISAAISRCHNPNDGGFRNYGGRGISVYEPWRADRKGFLAHLLTLDGWDNKKLDMDRIDVEKGYEPGNLRFITRRENCNNKRTINEMQLRIHELEERLRLAELRAAEQVHGADGARPATGS